MPEAVTSGIQFAGSLLEWSAITPYLSDTESAANERRVSDFTQRHLETGENRFYIGIPDDEPDRQQMYATAFKASKVQVT